MFLNFVFDRILESKMHDNVKNFNQQFIRIQYDIIFVDVNEIKLQIDVCVWSKMGTLSTTTTTTSIYQLYNYADVQ